MEKSALKNFLEYGYSCSESIVMAAVEKGFVPENLLDTATGFSGGMGAGCLCGAVSGSIIVLGYIFGKNKTNTARGLSKKFLEEFKKSHSATCCRVLTSKFDDFHSKERKLHCSNMVQFCARLLEKIINEEKSKV